MQVAVFYPSNVATPLPILTVLLLLSLRGGGGGGLPVQVEQQVCRCLCVVALVPERRVRFHPGRLHPQLLLLRATPRCHNDGRRVLHLVGVFSAQAEEVRLLVLEGR